TSCPDWVRTLSVIDPRAGSILRFGSGDHDAKTTTIPPVSLREHDSGVEYLPAGYRPVAGAGAGPRADPGLVHAAGAVRAPADRVAGHQSAQLAELRLRHEPGQD